MQDAPRPTSSPTHVTDDASDRGRVAPGVAATDLACLSGSRGSGSDPEPSAAEVRRHGGSRMSSPVDSLALLFAAGLLVALALTGLARGAARRVGLVDRPDGRRKIHDRVIPVAGGLAVF